MYRWINHSFQSNPTLEIYQHVNNDGSANTVVGQPTDVPCIPVQCQKSHASDTQWHTWEEEVGQKPWVLSWGRVGSDAACPPTSAHHGSSALQ